MGDIGERALSDVGPHPLTPSPESEGGVRFAGYAAVFDHVDRGGDVVRRGAFAGAGAVPLLWQHKPGAVIGTVEYLREDKRGLRVIGRISPRTAAGREAAALLKEGAVIGLSFGYRVREASEDKPRELRALDLVEVSLVRFPMQPLARVHAVEE
ncbi:HK97 family phage prohead protease [Rhizorhapis sp.]|uniref:HK97 family phage prohead protease n=1 Tax=Rhizorhapis sp. TaxID=1968842 RepID=UPI002B49303A|nr:HK97 family phage prohead protease [Rhizorhapis sp.]HKR17002.1 HK97 family phage prohead protease [Rhizorhapis sp.]